MPCQSDTMGIGVHIAFVWCVLIQYSYGASFVPGKGCGGSIEIRSLKGPLKRSMLRPCGILLQRPGKQIEEGNTGRTF